MFFYVTRISYIYYVINRGYVFPLKESSMTIKEICELLAYGDLQEAKAIIQDRKQMPESRLRMIAEVLTDYPVRFEHEPMSESNWYYISRTDEERTYVGSQFYWIKGSYDENGEHSLYDEYGYAK